MDFPIADFLADNRVQATIATLATLCYAWWVWRVSDDDTRDRWFELIVLSLLVFNDVLSFTSLVYILLGSGIVRELAGMRKEMKGRNEAVCAELKGLNETLEKLGDAHSG